MTQRDSAEGFLPLSEPVLQILISLNTNELHGYGILLDIDHRMGRTDVLSTSSLYGAIKRMIRDGLIEESDRRPDPDDDQRRRYYRIRPLGREVLAAEAARIRQLARTIAGIG